MKNLYSFILIIFALSATLQIQGQIVVAGDNTPLDIPDDGCTTNNNAASLAEVTQASADAVVSYTDLACHPSYIIDTVKIDITHTFDADLEITLKSFSTEIDLASDLGVNGDDFTNTRFRDGFPSITAGSPPFTGVFSPEGGAFAEVFDMEPVRGFWSLSICDDFSADVGTLNSYSISFSPTNDLCASATPIVMGTNQRGSNIGASINNLSNALRSCSDDPSEAGRGVWYTYTGTGATVIASTEHAYTDFDTEILVFTGDCSNLVCFAGNDRGGANNTSKVAFVGALDTDYYIYIDGALDNDNSLSSGVFELSIETAVANNTIAGAIPATFVNDIDSECTTVTSLNFSIGTTRSGLGITCDGEDKGRDQFFSYVTRTDTLLWDSRGSGPGIVIWDESGTTELSCSINFIDAKLHGWERGDTIIIQIYDFITDFPTGPVIDFCIRDYLPSLPNDECETAIPLSPHNDLGCGLSTEGTLYGATQSNTGSATTTFYDEHDVWFSFVATDTVHLVDFDNRDIEFDLIEEECAVHMSIATSSDNRSRVGGLTIGDTYLIRAYDGSFRADPYREVTFDICIGLLSPEDICSGAISLPVDAICSPQLFTFEGAASESGECNEASVWFQIIVPNTGTVQITTSSPGTSPDTELAVFRGNCNNLTEIVDCTDINNTGDQEHEAIVVTGTSGETLYILVSDDGDDLGSFSICVEIFTGQLIIPSDDCAGAELLDVEDTCEPKGLYTFEGATNGDDECDYIGVWFKVAVPASGAVVFSTLFPGSNDDTEIKVYTGSCGNLTLLSEDCQDDDNTAFVNHEQIIISNQTPGDALYIVVDDRDEGGTFSVCVFDPGLILPTSDDCEGAVLLDVDDTCEPKGPYTFEGATNGDDECDHNGVWFKVEVPASGAVVFSTLFPGSNDDTEIKVYSGSCGDFTLLSEDCQDDNNTVFESHEVILISNQTPGDTLYIVVDDRGEGGTFSVCVFDLGSINIAIPADECADATMLSVQSTCDPSYFTFAAATEGADEPCNDPGVWFKTTVPSSGSFTVTTTDVEGLETGIELSIYAGSCGSLVPINQECQDIDNAGGENERYRLTDRAPGEDIYIFVTDDFDDQLVFGICLSEANSNANCSQSELDVNLAQIAFFQDSTYKTTGVISSGVTIDQHQEFLFRAPQQIDLNLNFTVPLGVQFDAEIGPCED